MTSKYTRRDFMSNTALAGLVAASSVGQAAQPATGRNYIYPSAGSSRLLSLLEIDLPIIQAPSGGVVNHHMTAAVANAGGLGAIPLSWSSPEGAAQQIAATQATTDNSIFVNFVLHLEPRALQTALDSGVRIVQFSWGMPDANMIDAIRAAKGVMGIQVTSEASAREALALGADYLVCQGSEAGGHVQASMPLARALDEVLSVAKDTPVVASGGIASGHKMRDYMQQGAAGVVMGSRFVATRESGAHNAYKEALVNAKSADTVFTTCMNKGWDNATHRILRNSTFEMWETAGCPAEGSRPGEKDVVATFGADTAVERYSINSPSKSYSGDIEALANYAGTSVDDINDIPSIDEVVRRIWEEFGTPDQAPA